MQNSDFVKQYITIPNCLTVCRIIGSAALLALRPLSPAFYILYTLAGVTDILDGWIARATKSASEFGAKLDSVSDMVFYAVMILKILPVLQKMLPGLFWWLAGLVLLIRLAAYLVAATKYHRFASLHTYGNKVTGALVFLMPYFLLTPIYTPCCFGVCAAGLLSSCEELAVHLLSKEYNPHRKSFFHLN